MHVPRRHFGHLFAICKLSLRAGLHPRENALKQSCLHTEFAFPPATHVAIIGIRLAAGGSQLGGTYCIDSSRLVVLYSMCPKKIGSERAGSVFQFNEARHRWNFLRVKNVGTASWRAMSFWIRGEWERDVSKLLSMKSAQSKYMKGLMSY